ncbi:hypothetical protein GKP91_04255 [Salmonella enterica subsp. enterica serovar Java]|nr:hypothetical protein [Salmonella enterica]ECE8724250.1 hypothetical protein [Salmonella enterica subsp. enterica serovar Java]EDR9849086.1 hypothetical protein [Salmonella enterica subsp. enterica]EAR4482746.1 hypothetical protein [Salmonella enterica]EAU8491211.1 hypothetical protein [Salmonella enterica]
MHTTDIIKILSIFVIMITGISAPLAANLVVNNDSLSVRGFDFSQENTSKAKDVYGACYRLEEPLFIDLSAEGNGVAGKWSWVSKVRFTLAQSKVVSPYSPGNLSAKDLPKGVTWVENPDRVMPSSGLWELGERTSWSTYIRGQGVTHQEGWEVGTFGVNNNIVTQKVRIPTRNLKTLEFIFTSEANDNDVHFMFERQPGTNYMKNTSVWYPNAGQSNNSVEKNPRNIMNVSGLTYDGFNLVRVEKISFKGRQSMYDPVYIEMGAYEASFEVEPDTEKYGFTAAQYDAACK